MSIIKKIQKYKWVIKLIGEVKGEDRKNLIHGYKTRKRFYASPIPEWDADLKKMAKCAMCPNMCRFDCPALLVSKREPYSPANKARLGLFMGMGRVPLDNPSAIDALYACMNCNACLQWCPMDISTGDLLCQMRAELEKKNLIPERMHSLKTNIEKTNSIFEDSPFKADSEFNINMPNSEVFYYIGCMSAKKRPSMVRATIAILKQLGINFSTRFDARVCCGSPINKVGFRSVASGLATKNVELIKSSGAKIILTDCPACAQMLSTTYKNEFNQKIKPKVVHSISYFLDLINKGILKPSISVDKKIGYHDPCILTRVMDKTEESRELFAKIPGIKLQLPFLHGEETRCCGMGGGYHVSNVDFSNTLGQERLGQLRKNSPDYIVSACPTCEFMFLEAKKNSPDVKDEVKDIIELLADSLGIKY